MTRFADGPTVEVSAQIAAPTARVWELVTDINLPARFQDEYLGGRWIDTDGPSLGAQFRGSNARGERAWETTSWITGYVPGEEFTWSVSDPDVPGATWGFRLDEAGDGTRLVFRRVLGPGPSGLTRMIAADPDNEEAIIAARDAEHRRHMQAVVDGIKALAEQA